MAMHPTRRDFLRTLAGAASGLYAFGALGPLGRLAHAEIAKDRHYVLVYFAGGWDILLSLDPRDPATFTNGNLNATRIQPGYELLRSNAVSTTRYPYSVAQSGPLRRAKTGVTFGPHIGDLFQHADKLCVVRGLSMDTLTHDAGRRRFLTGKPPSGVQARGSSATSWLASRLGQDDPIPNLAVRVESFNVELPDYSTAVLVDSVPDLLTALRPGTPALGPDLERQLDAFLRGAASCSSARRSATWRSAETSRVRARNLTAAQLDTRFDFSANTPEMVKLRSQYGIGSDLSAPEAQAAMAGRAITSGISRVAAYVANAESLDTHYQNWATNQGATQERGFNTIARLIEDLAATEYKGSGSSWLDHTTIVAFSEFSRTAMLNDSTGRDHALTNCCLLAGAGVKGGTVVGASSDVGMTPQAIDLGSGALDPGGEVVHPEHIWQALFSEVGLTTEPDLRVAPLRAILA